jgi:peptidoglycan hydrolase-like protein with peptidoglycan-binding domain
LTRGAVIRYQQENNITPAIGYFGPITRASIIQDLLSKFLTEVN